MSSLGDDADDDNYKPPITSPSSVILLLLGSLSLMLTTFVAVSIRRNGTKSASSKLVFIINCAQGMVILSKLPFVFNNIPFGCLISQLMLIYSFTQLWLVSYMMLLCTNHLKLDLQSTVYSSTDLGLKWTYELFIYAFPLLATILPLSADAFEEKYNWCVTDPYVRLGFLILVQTALYMMVIFGLMGHRAWVIYVRAKEYAHMLPPNKLLERILKGPLLYAIITISFGFIGVVMIRGSDAMHDQSTQQAYYLHYAIVYLFYLPGYANFFMFFVERRYLKIFEKHIAEVREFETGFDFEDISDDEEDVKACDALSTGTSICEHSASSAAGVAVLRGDGTLLDPLMNFEESGF